MGLKWDDVNLETGETQIRHQLQLVGKRLGLQELKTEKSQRTLILPDVSIQALNAHRTKQREERLKAGADWVDSGLVFATYARRAGRKVGAPLAPRNALRLLHDLLDATEPKIAPIRSRPKTLCRELVDRRRRRTGRGLNAARTLRTARHGRSVFAPAKQTAAKCFESLRMIASKVAYR